MKQASLFSVILVLIASSGTADVVAGPAAGRLPPCPDKLNCVSSQSTDKRHAIEPLHYDSSREKARQTLLEIIASWKRAHVVAAEGNRIHAEFTSALFHFVDDVDFLFDDQTKTIHVRSASRVGYSDLGVNRRRVEDIRARFNELSKKGDER